MNGLINCAGVVGMVGVLYASAPPCADEGRSAESGRPAAEDKGAQVLATIADEPELRFPRSGVARVRFEKGLNHVLVQVVDANGGEHTFFIDTGASFSVVTPRFLKTVDAPARGSPMAGAAHGAQGPLPGPVQLRELRDLRVGDLRIERAGAVALELSDAVEEKLGTKIHGILGYNILSRVITVIDYSASEVMFLDPGRPDVLDSLGEPAHVVPFSMRLRALIEVTGSVNGQGELPFIVDVGSRYTILNGPASRRSGISFEPMSDDRVALGCGVGPGVPVRRGVASSLRFGGLRYDEPVLYSIDLPVFATLGFGEREAGVLGNDLLGHYRVAIDYGRSELRFWRR